MSKYGDILDKENSISQSEALSTEPLPLVQPATADPKPASKYGAILDTEELHAKSVMFDATQHPPDTFAQATKLGRRFKMDPRLVMEDLDSYQRAAKMSDNLAAAALSPELRKALANPRLAPMVQDDAKVLSNWVSLVNSFKRSPSAMQSTYHQTQANSRQDVINQLDHIDSQLAKSVNPDDIEIQGSNDPSLNMAVMSYARMSLNQKVAIRQKLMAAQTGHLESFVEQQQAMSKIPMNESVRAAISAKTAGEFWEHFKKDPVGLVASIGPESLVQSLPGLIAAAGALRRGGKVAGGATQGASSFTLDYASTVVEQLQKRGVDMNDADAIRKAIADKETMAEIELAAKLHATSVGVFDALSFGIASKFIPNRPLLTVAVQTPAQGALGAFGETGGQVLEHLGTAKDGKPFELEFGKVAAEFFGEAFGAPVDTAAAAIALRKQRKATKAASSKARTDNLDKMAEAAMASKLKERDPQAFSEFVQDAAERTGQDTEAVYVDPAVLADALNQDGIDPESIPGVADQLQEALELGAPVKIKTGDYAAHVSGTPLHDKLSSDIKIDPDDLTINEQKEVTQQDQAAFDAELGEALADADVQVKQAAESEAIRTNIEKQLTDTKRFQPEVNKAYSELISNFYTSTAQRAGMTAKELFDAQPLKFAAESPAGAALNDRGQSNRGAFLPDQNLIVVLKDADLTTVLHEVGHTFLELTERISDASPELQQDMQTIFDWSGVKDLAAWRAMSLDQKRASHEKFARGFEKYLFEGKSPNVEMQSIFRRFASWLRVVYKKMSALNVNLTDDVRGVMDRMIASDEQIQEAKGYHDHTAMFDAADIAKMSASEWVDYQKTAQQANAEAVEQLSTRAAKDMKWLSNTRNRVLKNLQNEASARRKAVEDELRNEISQRPEYAVQRLLKKGEALDSAGNVVELDAKIATDSLTELYPGGEVKPNDLRGMTNQDGIHPDVIAPLMGFTSGDHMIQAIVNAEPLADVVTRETDAAMLERYGDLNSEQAINEAANKALANEARGRLIRAELRALERATKGMQRNGLIAQAKAMAADRIGKTLVRDIKPSQYMAAAMRNAKKAKTYLAKGDLAAAAATKRNQLLHHYAARESHKARDTVAKGLRYLKKFDKPGTRKNLDIDYLDQIDVMLERFDLKKRSQREVRSRASLPVWVKSQEDQGFTPTIDPALLEEARRQNYTTLTVDELTGLIDAVKNIEHLARLKKKLLTDKDNREFRAAADDMANHALNNAKRVKDIPVERSKWRQRTKKLGLGHLKLSTFIEKLDGHIDGGPWWEAIMRQVNQAGDREATIMQEAGAAIDKLFQSINLTLPQMKHIPAINDSLSLEARLSIALNWGNETNRRRVRDGDKWNDAQVTAILSTLTPAHWDFVQGVWDHIDTYWAEISAKQRRVSGVVPEKVAAHAFVTPDGKAMKGGYYPIKYDTRVSNKAEQHDKADAATRMMKGAFTSSTTQRGHVEQRQENVGMAVKKELNVISQHIGEVVHDLTHHEMLIDVNRLMKDDKLTGVIKTTLSPEAYSEMLKHIESIAAGDVVARNEWESFVGHMRNGATVAALGANASTALTQLTGLLPAAAKVGPVHMLRGLGEYMAHPINATRSVQERSEFMRNRGRTMSREVRDALRRSGPVGKTRNVMQIAWFLGIQKMQQTVDMPTWLGQYQKSIRAGESEARSIHLADQAVLDTQGGGQIKDQADFQRGSPAQKMFTNFMSYGITMLNLMHNRAHRRTLSNPVDMVKVLIEYMVIIAIPGMAYELFKSITKGKDLDEEEWEKILLHSQLSSVLGMFIGLRELGGVIAGFNNYSGPAGSRFFSEATKLATQTGQMEMDEAMIKSLVNTAGIAAHLPAGQIIKTIEGATALVEGDSKNPMSLLFGPPK